MPFPLHLPVQPQAFSLLPGLRHLLISHLTDKLSTDVTGDKNINAIQGGIAEGVGGTLSSGGILGGMGDMTSKEGVNRAERGDPGVDNPLAKKEAPKSWTETLSGGYVGGKK